MVSDKSSATFYFCYPGSERNPIFSNKQLFHVFWVLVVVFLGSCGQLSRFWNTIFLDVRNFLWRQQDYLLLVAGVVITFEVYEKKESQMAPHPLLVSG